MAVDAFALLAVPLQRCLWQMGWTHLRAIQAQAIELVLRSEYDGLISASTAAGKTEAAFLPVLSKIYESPQPSVQALYVGPLKALINDQFRRLDELCEHAEIPVHRWHGDVTAGRKSKLLAKPAGVLLITPESIESLFVNRSSALAKLFRHLQFIVIDEVHAFVGHERGRHLRSLLFRLERYVSAPYRLLALSATLGDAVPQYAKWMRPEQPERVHLIDDPDGQRSIRFRINGYTVGKTGTQPRSVEESASQHLVADLYNQVAGNKNLIFANAKGDVEYYADLLNGICLKQGRPPEFLVHHGSVSKDVREHTEELMRSNRPHSTLCSSTLELGIDIGNVAQVGQIGVPWTVASQVQRLGRSGRREDEPSIMQVYLEEQTLSPGSDLADRLRPSLLQAVALTELMLEHWIEPPRIDELDFSTLIQQVLSTLVERGGAKATELFDCLVARGAFARVVPQQFAELLHCLANHDLIEQTSEGELILGLEGEAIVRSYEFYSAFLTPPEYDVICGSKSIGKLPSSIRLPEPGDHFLLSGRRWEVLEIDANRQQILVVLAKKRKRPEFAGSSADIHTVVRRKMREVLLSEKNFAYLNPEARDWLESSRNDARQSGLDDTQWVRYGRNACELYPWVGSRTLTAMQLLARFAKLDVSTIPDRKPPIALRFAKNQPEVSDTLRRVLASCPSADELAAQMTAKHLRKYDVYLSDPLLHCNLADSALDLEEAVHELVRMVGYRS